MREEERAGPRGGALAPMSGASARDRSRPPPVGPPRPISFLPSDEIVLSSGLRVVTIPRRRVPLVVAQLVVPGGVGVLEPGQAGLAALTADMLDEGTSGFTALELSDAVESLGARLRSSASWDANGVRLLTLRDRLPRALDLLAEVALQPTFPPHELARVKDERLTRILQERDEPTALASNAMARVLYPPEDPYSQPVLGTGESLRRLGRDDVVGYWKRWYHPEHAILVLAGDVSADEAAPLLESRFDDWPGGPTPRDPPVPEPAGAEGATLALVDRPGAPQSEIRVGSIGVARRTPDYFPLLVLNTILGGSFTSRLNSVLREERGYTYGASSYFAMRRRPGPFVARAAVHTPVTADAVAEFLNQLGRIREHPASEEELVRARNFLAYRLPQRFETVDDLADRGAGLVLYDLPRDHYDRYVERVQAVTREDVARVARKHLDPQAMSVVVAGDRVALEEPLRRLGLGPVRILALPGAGAGSSDTGIPKGRKSSPR